MSLLSFMSLFVVGVDHYGIFRADADYKKSRKLKTDICEGYSIAVKILISVSTFQISSDGIIQNFIY